MAKILVIRFSALGDVAMTMPVIATFANKYPQHQITILSRETFSPLFNISLPSNVTFKGVDLKHRYRGIKGIFNLFSELKNEHFDFVADLHDVLRTKLLRLLFWFSGHKCAHINKDRRGKKELVRFKNKKLVQLKSSFERYQDVFKELGFDFDLDYNSVITKNNETLSKASGDYTKKDNDKWIGIAPFAAHKGKIYPLEKQEKVIKILSKDPNVKIFLFGGGKREKEILSNWEKIGDNITSLAGKLTLDKEILLMDKLDVMVSMDSGNMHLASLVNTPVVSIWGATHPFAGFMGWKQAYNNAIQIDLPCRPCSIYGKKPCIYGDYRCLNNIKEEVIVEKINSIIYKQR